MTGAEGLATHGFLAEKLDLSSLGCLSSYAKLFGNCMSIPVVGACLCACLVSVDWGAGPLRGGGKFESTCLTC
eukprot:8347847-Alexandrium_andersonii.AAC.1